MVFKTSDLIVALWGGVFVGFLFGIMFCVGFRLYKCLF